MKKIISLFIKNDTENTEEILQSFFYIFTILLILTILSFFPETKTITTELDLINSDIYSKIINLTKFISPLNKIISSIVTITFIMLPITDKTNIYHEKWYKLYETSIEFSLILNLISQILNNLNMYEFNYYETLIKILNEASKHNLFTIIYALGYIVSTINLILLIIGYFYQSTKYPFTLSE